MAKSLHRSTFAGDLVPADRSCDGRLRTAYVRLSDPQRWQPVGTYCDGCYGFWAQAKGRTLHRPGARWDYGDVAGEP